MAFRSALFLLLLVLSLVAKSSAGAISDASWGLVTIGGGGGSSSSNACIGAAGLVGECVDEDEEFGLESESTRRELRGRGGRRRFIGYGALKKNSVPCSRRGRSYYNCYSQGRANPYRRGCTAITRCARDLN